MEKKSGIILCGGRGTRMLPITKVINKHMIPILNKPMILYPLQTLIAMGITDILIVSGGGHLGDLAEFLGDGSDYRVNLTYKVQKEAGGIAQALLLGEGFVKEEFVVILGDNYFETAPTYSGQYGIVIKEVDNPKRFGVLAYNQIEEKPSYPRSNLAVTGLYFYTSKIFNYIKTLSPSDRGELEITDVNNWCLKNFDVETIVYTDFWSDMGTPESMLATIKHLYV